MTTCQDDDNHVEIVTAIPLAPGLRAAECQTPELTTVLWLLVDDPDRCTCSDLGCGCPDCAPHEQTGRLPAEIRLRLGLQCQWVNPRSGKRCHTSVDRAGDSCDRHTGTVVRCAFVDLAGHPCRAWTNYPTGYCAKYRHARWAER